MCSEIKQQSNAKIYPKASIRAVEVEIKQAEKKLIFKLNVNKACKMRAECSAESAFMGMNNI